MTLTVKRTRKLRSRPAVHVNPSRGPLQEVIYDALYENAMRDAMVLYYNPPLLEMQKRQGILPKRIKTLESIYKAILKNAFEEKRVEQALPRAASHHDIAKACACHLN